MNIFASLKVYASKWSVKTMRDENGNVVENPRSFDAEELAFISSAKVVPSEYGNSVEFLRVNGGKVYIPLDKNSTLGVGDTVDLTEAKVLTLEKPGEKDIIRVVI